MYAKIENGKILFPPPNKNDNILNYCGDSKMLETDGYINYSEEEINTLLQNQNAIENKEVKKDTLDIQIKGLEDKQFRSLKAIATNMATDLDRSKYQDYENQIIELRQQLAQL